MQQYKTKYKKQLSFVKYVLKYIYAEIRNKDELYFSFFYL